MSLKFLRSLIFIAICALTSFAAIAQNGTSETQYFVPQPFPRSPTTTALEKYGTYQVNDFTGVPDISIPLYTIEAGGFQVPITLSYHASGNKVTEVASWCGLGWSVLTGGGNQITRRVYGQPDDGSNGYLLGTMETTFDPHTPEGAYYLEKASDGTFDTRPDIYSYDFPGASGKFFFDGSAGNGTYPIRLLPYAPLKINYTMYKHFTITDQHGNVYIYGDSAIDSISSSTAGAGAVTAQSAWKLTKMISQNRRDTVSFSYQSNLIYYPEADGETYTVLDEAAPAGAGPTPYYAYYQTQPLSPGNNNATVENNPDTIAFKNGRVIFVKDTNARTDTRGTAYGLQQIQVYAYNYGIKAMELQKTIVFWKSHFINLDNTGRLRLDSIQVLDKAGAVMQHYSFDYNTATPLPGYYSKAQDYWGYYNGMLNNTLLTPRTEIAYQPTPLQPIDSVFIGNGVDNGRRCDSVYMQAFILTGIHYPTGGYTTFAYQTNRYDSLGAVWLAGGLRISAITSYDGINPTPLVKTYVYNQVKINFNLSSSYFLTTQTHRYWISTGDGGPVMSGTAQVRSYSSNPHNDLEGYDAAPVVYPSVTEYTGTPGNNAGKTDYLFTYQKDDVSDASNPGNIVYISYFYLRGLLSRKTEFIRKADGSYQPVKLTDNVYSALPDAIYTDVGYSVFKRIYNEGPRGENPMYATGINDDTQTGTFTGGFYSIASDDNYLTSSTTYVYDTNDSTKYTSSSVIYTYDDVTHQQIISTAHADSKGNTYVTGTKYAHSYLSGTTTHNVLLDSMINRHMFADVIEKGTALQNAATGTTTTIEGELNTYKNGSLPYSIVPATISTLSVAQPLTDFTPSAVVSGNLTADSRYVQMISFDRYDEQNNLAQYTPRNGTTTAIMWDHTFELPVAQIKNVPAFEPQFDYAYTGFEADSYGSWYYNGKPVFDPTAPAGSFSYPLSSGAISPNITLSAGSYVLSYWSNGAAATLTYNGTTYPATAFQTVNGWIYYEHSLPVITGGGNPSLSGSMSIDELRLYPANAQMTTYNYDPSGLRSIADTKGANSYFEYDFLQRLKNVKDWAGNIVKNYGYHMYNMMVNNQAQSATFARNNCPANTTPGTLVYSVPANRYYGTSLASANADAIYDMNVNGQIKANANCACTPILIAVQVTNSTGITNYPITYSGIASPFLAPTGVSTIYVPQGNYSSVQVGPSGSGKYTFIMGARPSQSGVHYGTFTGVDILPGGADLTISITP